ncbi:hypothetical protein VCV18_007645 [Metarhizium anisopliae]
MVLLGGRILCRSLVFRLPLDTAVGVHAPNDAVGLGEDFAPFFDERLHLSDELFLVQLLLWRALRPVDLVGDHPEDGLDLVERLLDGGGELAGKLPVLFGLLSLLLVFGRLLWFGRNVLEETDVANGHALGIDHVPVVVNLLPGANAQVAADQLANDVAVLVDDVALAVDSAPGKGILLLLDHGLLPPLRRAQDVAVLVDDIPVLVHGPAVQDLAVAAGSLARSLALRLGDQFGASYLLARLAHDVALFVAHAAYESLDVALDDPAKDLTVSVYDVAGFVNSLSSQGRHVNDLGGDFLWLVPGFGLADDIAATVENVAVLVDAAALHALGVAFNHFANLPALGHDTSVAFNDGIWEVLERREFFGCFIAVGVGDGLRLADDLAGLVPDLSLFIGRPAHQLFGVAVNEPSDNVPLVIDQVAGFVDLGAFEYRKVQRFFSCLACFLCAFFDLLSLCSLACGFILSLTNSKFTQFILAGLNFILINGSLARLSFAQCIFAELTLILTGDFILCLTEGVFTRLSFAQSVFTESTFTPAGNFILPLPEGVLARHGFTFTPAGDLILGLTEGVFTRLSFFQLVLAQVVPSKLTLFMLKLSCLVLTKLVIARSTFDFLERLLSFRSSFNCLLQRLGNIPGVFLRNRSRALGGQGADLFSGVFSSLTQSRLCSSTLVLGSRCHCLSSLLVWGFQPLRLGAEIPLRVGIWSSPPAGSLAAETPSPVWPASGLWPWENLL